MHHGDLEYDNGKTKMVVRDGKYFGYYQYGMCRTATTLVSRMIAENYKVHFRNNLYMRDSAVRPPNLDSDWKHHVHVPNNLPENVPVVLCYKNPYTWLESMLYRNGIANGAWQQTHGKEFNNRRQKYRVEPKEGYSNGTGFVDDLLYSYKQWFDTWLPYYENNKDMTVKISYEHDMLNKDNLIPLFNGMANKFGWPEYDFPQIQWPRQVGSSQEFNNTKHNYYLEGRPTELPQWAIDLVPEIMGEDLLKSLNYSVL
ncbi:MAG: hypothetical protein HN775_07495 [Hellea sp.]|jgi:hypothetical protein|nr:hypothetical protein [Hellea sp.]